MGKTDTAAAAASKPPKRAITAFMFFSTEMRKTIKEQNPSLSMTQVAEVLGKLWSTMTDADKAKYQEMADADKKRYENEKAAQPVSSSSSSSSSPSKVGGAAAGGGAKGKITRKPKDPNSPKRGLSAYLYFANDVRPQLRQQYPSDPITIISSKIGELWGQLTPAQRHPYEEKAEADKRRYERELEVYKSIANSGGSSAAETQPLGDAGDDDDNDDDHLDDEA